jgi:hypothetical protein
LLQAALSVDEAQWVNARLIAQTDSATLSDRFENYAGA